jgi:3-dehydroquinate dehydratase type I
MELCLIIAEKTASEAISTIAKYSPLIDSVEIRVDYFEESELDKLPAIRAATTKKAIVTARRNADGGQWSLSESLRESVYELAIAAKFDFIDIEVGALTHIKGKGCTRIIRSCHDFKGVPSDILDTYLLAGSDPDEIPKIAVMLKDAGDTLRFLAWNEKIRKMDKRDRIITAMGKKGLFSRILGQRIGTMHTYLPVPKMLIVPGMIDIEQAANQYRIRSIEAETRVHGVLDYASSFFPDQTPAPNVHPALIDDTIHVPFVLDNSEEMRCIRDYFDIKRFFRVYA